MQKTIFFDFDGVILDSFAPAYEVSSYMHPRMSESEYREAFEGNINDTDSHTHKCGDDCRKNLDFFTEYIPKVMNIAKPFDGMSECLIELHKKYRLCIISSTLTLPIMDLLSKFSMNNFFSDILGNDVHKSKVEKIKMLKEKYCLKNEDCVFVTDTLGDIKEASIVGVPAIAVSWGFHKVETLKRGNPIRIVGTTDELQKSISDHFELQKN